MPWQPNLETAQRLAAQTNRLVLIHFWAPWCRPCMKLEQEVFAKPETAKALEANFVLVKLNADDAPGTARLYGVSSLPSDVITLPNGRLVSQIQSPPTATQYVQQMNQAATGHRSLARKLTDAGTAPQAPAEGAIVAPSQPAFAPNTAGATPVDVMAATPGATAPPATVEPYAGYTPQGQPAANVSPEQGQVTPAQAYAAVPPTGPGAQAAPLSDPYAHPPVQPQAAPPAAAPYAAPPAADPYSAPSAADPYAATAPVAQMPPAQAPAAPAPVAPTAPMPPANPYAAPTAPPAADPYAAVPVQQPPVAPTVAPPVAAAPYAAQPAFQSQVNLPQLPPGCPPLALDGNCPVTLMERKRWAVGHPTFGAVHRGRTYLFLGPQERDKFLVEPDRFSPVLSGLDPVMALENRQSVPGKREFGVFGADGKIYLFADETTRARFEQNEQHYSATAAQAMQQPAYQAMRQ